MATKYLTLTAGGLAYAFSYDDGVTDGMPELPREYLTTTYSLPTGGTTHYAYGDEGANGPYNKTLTQCLADCALGDVIVLKAGSTYTGNWKLFDKGEGTDWIYIISSEVASLPASGTRVSPDDVANMPTIVPPSIGAEPYTAYPAIWSMFGAHHYRLVGLHVQCGVAIYTPIAFGNGLADPNSGDWSTKLYATEESQLPTDITVDRCYIHSTNIEPPWCRFRYGIGLEGIRMAVVDSYIDECHDSADSQAILTWNGGGPYKIVNNYLAATGENYMAGGNDPRIPDAVPHDIEFRYNHCFKPLWWKPISEEGAPSLHLVKNSFELKNAERVHVEGNVFENCWPSAQAGRAIVIKAVNQEGTANWSRVWDVTFENNVVKTASGGISLVGDENVSGGSTMGMKRVLISNNLIDCSTSEAWVGTLYAVSIASSNDMQGDGVIFDHNTIVTKTTTTSCWSIGTGYEFEYTNVTMTNNIWRRGANGIKGTGKAEGTASLTFYFEVYSYLNNLLIDYTGSSYPSGNFQCANIDAVGFTDYANGDFTLTAESAYKTAASDGTALGVNFTALNAAIAGVVEA